MAEGFLLLGACVLCLAVPIGMLAVVSNMDLTTKQGWSNLRDNLIWCWGAWMCYYPIIISFLVSFLLFPTTKTIAGAVAGAFLLLLHLAWLVHREERIDNHGRH